MATRIMRSPDLDVIRPAIRTFSFFRISCHYLLSRSESPRACARSSNCIHSAVLPIYGCGMSSIFF